MRHWIRASALVAGLILGTAGCHDDMTGPSQPMPTVDFVNPNPTHSASMIIFRGTHFDETATFTLQQGGDVMATLGERVYATGTPETSIQVDATIPAATPNGNYQACVTTRAGTGCYSLPVKVF